MNSVGHTKSDVAAFAKHISLHQWPIYHTVLLLHRNKTSSLRVLDNTSVKVWGIENWQDNSSTEEKEFWLSCYALDVIARRQNVSLKPLWTR